MNYQSIYDQIIAKHIDSPRIKGKTNSHHIIPKSFAKIDGIEDIDGKWNKVNLPHREHFIAHLLLARIWRGHKAKGSMMARAFKFMSENGKHTSKDYSWIKSTLDYSHSDETKMKISNASKGKPQSEETKIKRAIANTGKVRTEETKAKISAAQKGKPRKSQSKTSNAKRSAALKGKPRSEEFKRKMSIIAKNRSAEAKANLILSRKGKKHTEETKAKISAAAKRRYNTSHFIEDDL